MQLTDDAKVELIQSPEWQTVVEDPSFAGVDLQPMSNGASTISGVAITPTDELSPISETDRDPPQSRIKGMAGLYHRRFVKPQPLNIDENIPVHRYIRDEILGNMTTESENFDMLDYNQVTKIRRHIQRIQCRISHMPNALPKGVEHYNRHKDPSYPINPRMEYQYKEEIRLAIIDWSDYHEQKPLRKRPKGPKATAAQNLEAKQKQVLGRRLTNFAVQIISWDLVVVTVPIAYRKH